MTDLFPEVMYREASPRDRPLCTAEEIDKIRAIRNESGTQERASEPPVDTGEWTATYNPERD